MSYPTYFAWREVMACSVQKGPIACHPDRVKFCPDGNCKFAGVCKHAPKKMFTAKRPPHTDYDRAAIRAAIEKMGE